MARLTTVHPAAATGRAKDLLDAVQAQLGLVPNMARAMAANPAVLDADLAAVKRAGYGGAGIGEIVANVANVAINVFTNFFNSVAATDIDFPVVTAHAARQAA
jgi:DNA-binding IclR family transcriptional regulator